MTQIIHRIRTLVAGIVSPASPSFLDAVFNGVRSDTATPSGDHGALARAGAPTHRLRLHRRDLAAALRADPAAPEHELTTWPPASHGREARQGC